MSPRTWTVRSVPFGSDVAQQLVAELEQEIIARYGGPDATAVNPAEFTEPRGTFLVIADRRGTIGCAGVRSLGADAELKRMYIRPDRRREGHARRLLVAAEEYVRGRGLSRIVLESGPDLAEACALYESQGYLVIPNYGYYDDDQTRCYAKWL
ncbi:GNAT family N-acetyltransferase [Dermacoccaceae bacterium W4C1]